jgi:16S rRNA (uracil1498-N3)-methyltransferase
MRLTRVHVPAMLTAGSRQTIAGDAANHIVRVLRLEPGAPLIVFDGRGDEYAARIEAVRKGAVIVEV